MNDTNPDKKFVAIAVGNKAIRAKRRHILKSSPSFMRDLSIDDSIKNKIIGDTNTTKVIKIPQIGLLLNKYFTSPLKDDGNSSCSVSK